MLKENLESNRREVTLAYKTASIRSTTVFSWGIMVARQQWNNIFKVLKRKQSNKTVKGGFYIEENYSSKNKKKLRDSLITKKWENLTLGDLPHEKY